MSPTSTTEFYEKQYRLHRDGVAVCQNSVHDLRKAHRRVTNVLKVFNVPPESHAQNGTISAARALDVGCGLGYYSKALSLSGANVTGIDLSQAGIEAACASFPECQFRCVGWPDGLGADERFDLIWAVDLSVLNTFDVHAIKHTFVDEALKRLNPGGNIVVGWSTNFSGSNMGNWSHWSLETIRQLRGVCGFSAPHVADVPSRWLSSAMIQVASRVKRSLPVFLCRKNSQ